MRETFAVGRVGRRSREVVWLRERREPVFPGPWSVRAVVGPRREPGPGKEASRPGEASPPPARKKTPSGSPSAPSSGPSRSTAGDSGPRNPTGQLDLFP